MSGKNRAARRRAERKHGGPPPDYWDDYRRPMQIGIAVLVLAILGTAFLIVRARQAAQAEVDAYCTVYDETHELIVPTTTTTSTSTPGTTVVGPEGTTVDTVETVIKGFTDTTAGTTPPGSVPPAEVTTTTAPEDPNARLKTAVERRKAVGPQNIRDAWATLEKALSGTKLTASQQSEIQRARETVNDFAKNECHRDPPDLG